jgi:hypothetical protein
MSIYRETALLGAVVVVVEEEEEEEEEAACQSTRYNPLAVD